MIKSLLILVGCLLFGVLLMAAIKSDSGYILIHYGDTTIESTFWFAILCIVVIVGALYVLLKTTTKSWRGARKAFHWVSYVREKKADRRTHTGLIHFIEGNWGAAKKDLLKAAKGTEKPLIQVLAAARSAYELGDLEETHKLLHKAEQIAPEHKLAVALSQARIQLLDNKYEQCLATLERARQEAPNHPVVRDLLKQVYLQLNDWPALIKLLPELKATRQYPEHEIQALEEKIYLNVITEAGQKETTVNPGVGSDTERLLQAWQSLPKPMRKNPRLVAQYCRILLRTGLDEVAEPLLRETLQKKWHAELVELYGMTQGKPQEQLVVAEQWLRERPGDPHLLFALARISVRNQLWGKAREYFEASLNIEERPEIYAELAALSAQLGDHKKSTLLYQQGLLLTTQPLAVPKLAK